MPCSKVYILESFDRLVSVDNSIGCGAYFSSPSALPWSLNAFLRRMETGSQKPSDAAAEVWELLESVRCQLDAPVILCLECGCSLTRPSTCIRDRVSYDAPESRRVVPCPWSFVVYAFLLPAPTASAASFSAFMAKSTSGRPSRDADQHRETKFQTSSESHSLGPAGRLGRSPFTTLYTITPSLAPG